MEIIREPLSLAEIKKIKDEDNFIEGIVPLRLERIINGDIESFLDTLSNDLVGSSFLMQIDYEVVGHEGNTLLIKTSGDVTGILEFEESE